MIEWKFASNHVFWGNFGHLFSDICFGAFLFKRSKRSCKFVFRKNVQNIKIFDKLKFIWINLSITTMKSAPPFYLSRQAFVLLFLTAVRYIELIEELPIIITLVKTNVFILTFPHISKTWNSRLLQKFSTYQGVDFWQCYGHQISNTFSVAWKSVETKQDFRIKIQAS
jgi:hypothetical protein